VVLKAQVPTGGRGKAGGIKAVSNLEEAERTASHILHMRVNDFRVNAILVEEEIRIEGEYYLSILIDRSAGQPLLLASSKGGMDIESVSDGFLWQCYLDPNLGIDHRALIQISDRLNIPSHELDRFRRILEGSWSLFREKDCELVEINPLALSTVGLMALDAKMVINDDALFRHPEFEIQEEDYTPMELEARRRGISFVQLEGSIGVIANGAGLTMATLDVLSLHGGRGGAFLDLGGTDDPRKVMDAFEIIRMVEPSVILVNMFGGITKCDTVAEGIIGARRELGIDIPIVARIRGVNEAEARKMLEEVGIFSIDDLEKACEKAIDLEVG
jgi:succinyl-CoA synthetase beta subunit